MRICFYSAIWFFSLTLTVNAQPMHGTFTISHESADFVSFTEAIDSLIERGVSGHVKFIVQPGDYHEQIRIPNIEGASELATIEFLSSTGSVSDVRLLHKHESSSYGNNHTVFVDGADYITFSCMTIEAIPESPVAEDKNRVVVIAGGSNNILFRSNLIKSFYTTKSNWELNNCVLVSARNSFYKDLNNISFENNVILGGDIGIHFQGHVDFGNVVSTGLSIIGNVFENQKRGGIEIGNVNALVVEGNSLVGDDRSSNYWEGMTLRGLIGPCKINRNYIKANNGGSGIRLSGISTETDVIRKYISNNMIVLNSKISTNISFGIESRWCKNLVIAHNCIYQDSINNESVLFFAGLWGDEEEELIFVNNHMYHGGRGVCVEVEGWDDVSFNCNYNNYYTPDGIVAVLDEVEYDSLSGAQDQGFEPNGFSFDPKFAREDWLVSTNGLSYRSGVMTPILDDYFGNVRPNTSPSIGLYEGEVADYDVGLYEVRVADNEFCEQSNDLVLRIKNYGPEPLYSTILNFRLADNIDYTYSWTGQLSEGEISEPITLEDILENEEGQVKCWTEYPNEKMDLFPVNDTILFQYSKPISGELLVGPGGDFQSISDALALLEDRGVCGPTTINLLPGRYAGQIFIKDIAGLSQENTLTIQSSTLDKSSVIIESDGYSSTDYLFNLSNVEYVQVKYLTIEVGKVGGFSYGINVGLDCEDLSFQSIDLVSFSNSGTLFNVSQRDISGLSIDQCRFVDAKNQLVIDGLVGFSMSEDLVIRNCVFEGKSTYSIALDYIKDVTLEANEFYGERLEAAVNVMRCSDSVSVLNNVFYLDSGVALEVNSFDVGEGEKFGFYNNFVSTYDVALKIKSCESCEIIHNNFNLLGDKEALSKSIQSQYESFIFVNNIVNLQNGNLLYVIYGYSTEGYFFDFGNNTLFTHLDEDLYVYIDDEMQTLHDWREGYHYDITSFLANPVFVSDSDLHVLNPVAFDGMARAGTGVEFDIDGEERNVLYPDIGADEIVGGIEDKIDIAIVDVIYASNDTCIHSDFVAVEIWNNSSVVIDSFEVRYRFLSGNSDFVKVYKSIEPNGVVEHVIMDFQFNTNTLYKMKFEVDNPNGVIDDDLNNNVVDFEYYNFGRC